MSNQKSLTSEIQSKLAPKYHLKRIGEEPIVINQTTRDAILQQLAGNGRFVQIGEYTIMLNSIKSIDPIYGGKNIPPRPSKMITVREEYNKERNAVVQTEAINPEWEAWIEKYGDIEKEFTYE